MPGYVKFWLIVIGVLVGSYALHISIPAVITGFFHGLQQMHNSNAGH